MNKEGPFTIQVGVDENGKPITSGEYKTTEEAQGYIPMLQQGYEVDGFRVIPKQQEISDQNKRD